MPPSVSVACAGEHAQDICIIKLVTIESAYAARGLARAARGFACAPDLRHAAIAQLRLRSGASFRPQGLQTQSTSPIWSAQHIAMQACKKPAMLPWSGQIITKCHLQRHDSLKGTDREAALRIAAHDPESHLYAANEVADGPHLELLQR